MKKRLSLLLFLVSLVCCCCISNSMAQCSANAGEPTTATQSFGQGQAPTSINFSSGFSSPTPSGTSTQIAYLLTKNGDKFVTAKVDGEFYFNGNNDPNATLGSQYEAPLTGPLDSLCVSQVIYSAEEVTQFAIDINAYLDSVNLGFLQVPENGDISEVAVFVQAILIAANPGVEATLAEILEFLEPGVIKLANPVGNDPDTLEILIPELCFDVSTNKSCAAISCNVAAGNATGSTAYCFPEDAGNIPSTISASGSFSGNTTDGLVDDVSYLISGIGDTLVKCKDNGNFWINGADDPETTTVYENDANLAAQGDQICMYQLVYSSEELIAFEMDANQQLDEQGFTLLDLPETGSLEDLVDFLQALFVISGSKGTVDDILEFLVPGELCFANPVGPPDSLCIEIPALCFDISDSPYCYSYAACCATSASIDPVGSVCSNVPINLNGTVGGNATMGTWSTTGDGTFGNTGTLSTTYNPGPIEISNGAAQICLTTDDPDGPGACEATTECVFAFINTAGCTDPGACNYDSTAGCDSGMCIYETACDADPCTGGGIQVWDTASCGCVLQTATVSGCTDPTACNYNSAANCNDGSCQPVPTCNSDPCLGDVTVIDPLNSCNCVLSAAQVLGCTDPTACNYNSAANCNDGSCQPAPTCNSDPCLGDVTVIDPLNPCNCVLSAAQVSGCTDPLACNYNSAANCNDGSCVYETACDTDPCTNGGTFVWDATSCGCVLQIATALGCTDATACNYDATANCLDSSCIYETACDADPCTGGGVQVWDATSCGCVLQTATVSGCTDATACNYDATANCLDTSCIYETACDADPCTGGGVQVWDATNCACAIATATVVGCIDPTACNYDSAANCDNGTCIFETACDADPCTGGGVQVWDATTCACALQTPTALGCLDPTACNYDSAANCDNGTCIFETACDADPCTGGGIQVWDATTCACALQTATVVGCIDPTACNYDETANCDNGTCIFETACDTDVCTNGGTYVWDATTCACALQTATVLGCTDPTACNYDETANCLDTSCIYETSCDVDPCTGGGIQAWDATTCACAVVEVTVEGCTNPAAPNYDMNANCDDQTCECVPDGCNDLNACNYDPAATCNDGSCTFESACDTDPCTNGGVFAWDATTCECALSAATVSGCTDATACNYDAAANCLDSSCIYETACDTDPCTGGGVFAWDATTCACALSTATVEGCVDATACNYDSAANCEDGSCIYETACDTDPCSNGGSYVWDATTCACALSAATVSGCTDVTACNYDSAANCDDSSCIYETACDTDPCTDGGVYGWNTTSCSCELVAATVEGCTDVTFLNYNSSANCDDSSCSNDIYCDDPTACNYNPDPPTDATASIDACDFGNPNCTDPCAPVSGCTDATACNYNADACVDDGSCAIIAAGTIATADNTTVCVGDGTDDIITATASGSMGSYTFVITDGSATTILGQSDAGEFNVEGAPAGNCLIWGVAHDGSLNAPTDQVADLEGCFELSNSIEVIREQAGCTDVTASNYDASAQCDDGSCIIGSCCTDMTACNYDPDCDGVEDNSLCEYGNTDCTDPCAPVSGCTDADACNYNADACVDDNSCVTIAAGTIATADNTTVCVGDGTDDIITATADGSMGSYTFVITDGSATTILGQSDAGEFNVEGAPAGNCLIWGVAHDGSLNAPTDQVADLEGCFELSNSIEVIREQAGCTDETATNYDADAQCDDGSCIVDGDGCTDQTACNYNPAALVGNNDLCDYGNIDCPDPCAPVTGCTDADACNYNADACEDDDSCVIIAAGTIATTDNTTVCVGDGTDDIITATADGSMGSYTFVITDGSATTILGQSDAGEFNVEGAPAGNCLIWGVAHDGSLNAPTDQVADLEGCFELSNSIEVIREQAGCTDETATNYDADAQCDDGSCIFDNTVEGCTDPCAPNYDSTANTDDDSCDDYSTECNTDCTMGDLEEWDANSCSCVVTQVCETNGCGDPCAPNYNPDATVDDNSCEDYDTTCNTDCASGDITEWDANSCSCVVTTETVSGCTDATACNYNSDANCDDDSCVFIAAGTISTTDNTTTCSGDGIDDIITATVDGNMGSYTYVITDGTATTILGQSDSGEFNLEGAPAGTCLIWGVAHDGSLNAPTDQVADLEGCFELSNSIEVVRQDQLGCTDATACNYDADAQCDDGSCDFGDPSTCNTDCAQGDIEEWNAETCECDVTIETVSGCTDANASNYNADANCDEGCEYIGCTDPCAANYDENALDDDDSCEEYDTTCNQNCLMGDVEEWDPETCGCVPVIQSIIGCTDKEACNFDPVANCNDGCDYSCYCTIEASVEVVCGPIGDKFQLVFLFSGSDNGSYLLTNNDTGDFLVIDQPFYQSPVYYTDENEGFSYTVSLTADLDCNQTLSQTFVDCIVTAIDLVSFDGQATEQGNRLDWTSASEFNSDSYIVEKSTNGTDFYEIGTVKVAGNSNVKNDYYFLDKDVKSNVSYYRLVELDRSGAKKVVTDIVVITKEANNWDIDQIAPIPATDFINIDINSVDETNYTLEIYNVAGKLIRTTEGNVVAGVSSLKIDISDLPIGTYFINLTNGSETQVARFVKN